MTGVPAEFRAIELRLEIVGQQFRMARLAGALGKFAALVLPAVTLVFLAIGFFDLPVWGNIALTVGCLAIIGGAYLGVVHGILFERPSYAQIARRVEEEAARRDMPLSNAFINAVLLAQEYGVGRGGRLGALGIPAVLEEIRRETDPVDLAETVPWKPALRTWGWSMLVTGVCAAAVAGCWPTFVHGMHVLVHPGVFVPRTGSVRIVNVEPGNDTVLAGQAVNFVVQVVSPQRKAMDALLHLHFAGGKTETLAMSAMGSGNEQFRYELANIAESLNYFISAGDSESQSYHLDVMPEVHVAGYQVVAVPPAYTGREKVELRVSGKELTASKGSLEVPAGSRVDLRVDLDMPANEMMLERAGATAGTMVADADRRGFNFGQTLSETLRFDLQINDAAHRTLRRFPEENEAGSYFAIAAIPDGPPAVEVSQPGKDLDAKPGDSLPLAATFTDDYGLKRVGLEVAKGADGGFSPVKTWEIGGKGVRSFAAQYLLELAADQYKFGDTVRYRFVATDNRDLLALNPEWGPQTTLGQIYTVTFNDTALAAAKSTKVWDDLRQKLQEILQQQIKLRDRAKAFVAGMPIDDSRLLGESIGQGQTGIRAAIAGLAKDFPFENSMKLVQKSLQVLVTEDATAAVDRAADIAGLADNKTLMPAATRLRQHQTRIIDVLQALLAIAGTEETRATPVTQSEGGDVPNEAKAAWKKMAEDLAAFAKEQQKVMDATADLAKKPKDQFDKDDQQKLATAATVEDKWEKFLSQKLADMSKIAEQDQANVSLLEEMVQMKIELAMAKDALATQATQIAVPLEESALENAAELTSHIEQWLSQQPDRTKWEMEEMAGQNQAPMAELPKQLQDMVGDLMDQEEDLTQEMESQASKWADSMDKGAGWDALDGPISNMSAQGVTGNQLPKNNEIQGRSGEGREGRTSGEFVGAEAEGKEGRRTPTRMTPEPFSSGQVDDKGKQPAGGATGGGKKAGFGGEGLEGPGPDTPKDPMQRLQGRQAEIHNEAERLQIQAHGQGYEKFKLMEAAVYMQRADDAMKDKKYDNALLFQQLAVKSLNTAKVLASGQVHVTMDTSPEVDSKVQKEIDGALQGTMPKGYADPVKAYFEKLSNGTGQ